MQQSRDRYIAGIDEAGRGPLAGPVTAACVCFRKGYRNKHICDSKQIVAEKREELFPVIQQQAIAWAIVSVGPRRIEKLNILQASKLAMRLAAEKVWRGLRFRDDNANVHFLVDGNARLETNLSHETIIKGDETKVAISAASILAKVTRDRLMASLDERYPGYGLVDHKGYATEFHRQKIRELGPSRIHRTTFAGVAEFITATESFQIPVFQPLPFDSF